MRHGGGRAPKKSRMESCTDNVKQQMRAREQHTLLLAKQEDKKKPLRGQDSTGRRPMPHATPIMRHQRWLPMERCKKVLIGDKGKCNTYPKRI
jgi:hypothetical protein